ncbi:MAG: flagellar assembly protein FliH, partial [Treponema sp.]|nr:flagellar assembly protein FliH [Treponema sp.]
MAKAVFRPLEVAVVDERIVLEPPQAYFELGHLVAAEKEAEEVTAVEEYQGPTVEDLRREAEAFKAQLENERDDIIRSAREEADDIIKQAEETAFQEVKRKSDDAQVLKHEAEEEAERILETARQNAQEIEAAARSARENERKDAEEQGRLTGREAGYQEGKAEVDRLIERTRLVLERAQDKRGEILA